MQKDYPLATEARATVWSEAERAAFLRARGTVVVEHRGRFWKQIVRGFWEGVHPMARLSASQATPPTRLWWGYRAALKAADAPVANGAIPTYLIRDLDAFGEWRLSTRKRQDLRHCLRRTRIIRITDPALLKEQGYDVYTSFVARVGASSPLDKAAYDRRVTAWSADPHYLVLAGLAGDRLLGYIESYAVGGTAYLDQMHVSTEASDTRISVGLKYLSLEAFRRSGAAWEAVDGLYSPGGSGLDTFKLRMGCERVRIPSYHRILPPAEIYLRYRRPLTYFHLTGRGYESAPEVAMTQEGMV